MDFLIKCPDKLYKFSQCIISIEHWEKPFEIELSTKNRVIILGDIVYPLGQNRDDLIGCFEEYSITEVIKKLGGHFYLFFWRDDNSSLEVYASYGSMLPVYYTEGVEKLISSSVKKISDTLEQRGNYSKEFIVERLLFNYPLTEISVNESIKRLKTNHCLVVHDTINSYQYLDNLSLLNHDNSLSSEQLVELFIENSYKYAPHENFFLSFTGGFDGRTLLSVLCEKHKDRITTYSFGRIESTDVSIPQTQAKELDIPYQAFDLSDESYVEQSIALGEEFISSSSAEANFTRAHYLWACSNIKDQSKYILSGNFGSELLRSPHFTGIQFSDIMFKIITGSSEKKIIEDIYSTNLKLILPEEYKKLIKNILERIHELQWAKFKTKDLNKKYYYYLLDEELRRYFGPEVKSQTNYLYNRTPYLDFTFISELFKSEYSGLNSKFFEKNKIKRVKGQLLYANIIKRTNNDLFKMMTGKGYRPVDLLSFKGKLKITYSKLFSKQKEVNDPFVTKYLFEKNSINYYRDINIISELGFKTKNIKDLNNTHISSLFEHIKIYKNGG